MERCFHWSLDEGFFKSNCHITEENIDAISSVFFSFLACSSGTLGLMWGRDLPIDLGEAV
jgi:hypothetical protein